MKQFLLYDIFKTNIEMTVIVILIAAFIGIMMKKSKKNLIGLLVSLSVYAVCEIVYIICSHIIGSNLDYIGLNLYSPAMITVLISLFLGTLAIGCVIGFLIGFIILKIVKN